MKTTIIILFISFLGLYAQKNAILNDSNALNSVAFNRDSIAKYTYEEYVFPLRSYLYPNNTGLSDEELFKQYKLYQKARSEGIKFDEPEIKRSVLLEAKFKRILGENPYKYLASGRNTYEYEVTEVLLDKYGFYKIGDKIKVYERNHFLLDEGEYQFLFNMFGDTIVLFMYDKSIYDDDKFRHGIVDDFDWFEDHLHIMQDLYATDFYFPINIREKDSHKVLGNLTYEEYKKKCREINSRMKDKSKPFFWYEYKYENKPEKGE